MTSGRNPRLIPALALALSLPAWGAPAAATPPRAVETYTIDPVHSKAQFDVAHMFISTVSGKFTKFQGTILLDPADIAKSQVDVTIDVNSLTTDNATRDKHLLSPDFFDAAKYPTITFKSTGVTDLGNGNLQVSGSFTMHGKTQPITIAVSNWGTAPGAKPGTTLAGFRKGTVELKRSQYDMKTMIGPVGDAVDITLSVEANKVQPNP